MAPAESKVMFTAGAIVGMLLIGWYAKRANAKDWSQYEASHDSHDEKNVAAGAAHVAKTLR
jgi:hypothetical protein